MGEGAERVSECVWDQALSAAVGQRIAWVERFRVIEEPWQGKVVRKPYTAWTLAPCTS